jgi:class 3 adenylate cyclase
VIDLDNSLVSVGRVWGKPRRRKPSAAGRWARRRLNPEFVIAERLRRAMRKKRNGARIGDTLRRALVRGGTTGLCEFLGYTIADLATHLERQFAPGMSWAEFRAARIEIDHIRPLALFDLANADELRAAWALSNLQPLWAKDNREKAARFPA